MQEKVFRDSAINHGRNASGGVPSRAGDSREFAVAKAEMDKRYADLRLKMGQKKSPEKDEKDSLPSEISLEDAWGKLPAYQDMKHKEQMAREREALAKKRMDVKNTLDTQMQERIDLRRRHQEHIKQVDAEILRRAQAEMDEEKKQTEKLKAKTLAAKDARENMIKEAKKKRENEFRRQREKELTEVEELQKQLDAEKKAKVDKRNKEKEQAMKVIQQNEVELEKRR